MGQGKPSVPSSSPTAWASSHTCTPAAQPNVGLVVSCLLGKHNVGTLEARNLGRGSNQHEEKQEPAPTSWK
eukprot:5191313-Pyramimonas_sp.AAC.1